MDDRHKKSSTAGIMSQFAKQAISVSKTTASHTEGDNKPVQASAISLDAPAAVEILTPGASLKKESGKVNVLSYSELNKYFDTVGVPLIVEAYGVMILPKNTNFIAFSYQDNPDMAKDEGKIYEIAGLKFHISLKEREGVEVSGGGADEENNAALNFEKGWSIISTILRANNTHFKVIRHNRQMSDVPGQEGKAITVYATSGKDASDWREIIQEITKKLTDALVQPGYRPQGTVDKPEKIINGSNYVTYRYHDEDGRIKRLKGASRNQFLALLDKYGQLKDDPIANLKIFVENQLNIPKLEQIKDTSDQVLPKVHPRK